VATRGDTARLGNQVELISKHRWGSHSVVADRCRAYLQVDTGANVLS
jgi:hypothetical protein